MAKGAIAPGGMSCPLGPPGRAAAWVGAPGTATRVFVADELPVCEPACGKVNLSEAALAVRPIF
ncbi:MAG: hypothetical protein NVSMB39_6160 [Candidatus Saccharimonadales bacterium]